MKNKSSTLNMTPQDLAGWVGGGGGSTYNGLHREAPPKRGTIFTGHPTTVSS